MAINCPECSFVNPDNSTFCVKCGSRLPQVNPAGQYNTGMTSAPTYFTPPQNAPDPASSYNPPSPTLPPYPAPPTSYPPPGAPTGGTQWSPLTIAPPPPTTQMGTGQGLASFRRAFAGRGTLIMHFSWLLTGNNAYTQSGAINSSVVSILRQRSMVGTTIAQEKLMERGIAMEEREYIVARRGITTVFTYVAPAGPELYISRATTALPPISYIRVGILALLAALMIIGLIQPGLAGPSAYGVVGMSSFAILLYALSYPIAIFLVVMLIASFVYWLVENDFLVYLRANSLNDFQLDDIAMLEKMIDDTVREAVKQVGLDESKITSPQMVQGFRPRTHIRRI
ncbi:MAG TPA: hypothetical protein VNE61_12500 [Ktedonobacteraceae bacterium]|nr:hypothetical protein [Ktedonobacteraceae bacterium]